MRLPGHREWKGYKSNGRSVGIQEIVSLGVFDDIGCRAPDGGNMEVLFQRFAVSAHGRCAAVSAGYPDHGRLALFGYFLPEFRLVLHVGAFDCSDLHFHTRHILGKPGFHFCINAGSRLRASPTDIHQKYCLSFQGIQSGCQRYAIDHSIRGCRIQYPQFFRRICCRTYSDEKNKQCCGPYPFCQVAPPLQELLSYKHFYLVGQEQTWAKQE